MCRGAFAPDPETTAPTLRACALSAGCGSGRSCTSADERTPCLGPSSIMRTCCRSERAVVRVRGQSLHWIRPATGPSGWVTRVWRSCVRSLGFRASHTVHGVHHPGACVRRQRQAPVRLRRPGSAEGNISAAGPAMAERRARTGRRPIGPDRAAQDQVSVSFATPSGTEKRSHQIQISLKSATSRLAGMA